mmetsp:Transcript_40614/g.107289  ORF Transcript_40614/g.107289 Transcript_40614/m.107289 type:complete len:255 (-) Transcript_40614:530-1294(-)
MVVMHILGPHPHAPTLEVWFNMLHDRYMTVSCNPKQHKTATTCMSEPARMAPYRRGMPPLLLRLTNQPHPDHTCQKARPTPGRGDKKHQDDIQASAAVRGIRGSGGGEGGGEGEERAVTRAAAVLAAAAAAAVAGAGTAASLGVEGGGVEGGGDEGGRRAEAAAHGGSSGGCGSGGCGSRGGSGGSALASALAVGLGGRLWRSALRLAAAVRAAATAAALRQPLAERMPIRLSTPGKIQEGPGPSSHSGIAHNV